MLLYTNRNAVITVSYDDCINKKIDYLVYYKNAINNTEQLPLGSIKGNVDSFREVFRNGDFIVFKMVRPGS